MTKKIEDERPRHCDTFIHDLSKPPCLRWWLFINRLPAMDKMLCEQNGVSPKLFADYKGKRVRVTMASRLGDLGISYDRNRDMGYDERGVYVEDLSGFAADH